MYLVRLHPDAESYEVVEMDRMEKETNRVLAKWRLDSAAGEHRTTASSTDDLLEELNQGLNALAT